MAQLRIRTLDDLANAEDMAATLARALQTMLEEGCFEAEARAVDALAEFAGYCRDSCGYLDDGDCHAADPGVCGCICGHTDELDPLSRPDLRPHLNHPPLSSPV